MAVKHIYIVDLESVTSRYTCEWKEHLPKLLTNLADADTAVINISGGEDSIEASPGAFLNFQQTNIYKNNQLNDIARRFSNEVQPGDRFLFADAWHTGILQLKYMSELLGIPVEIHALWHAGSYDAHDFLGRLIKDKNWTYSTERALFHAIDHNYFATDFHIDMFCMNLLNTSKGFAAEWINSGKIVQTGWPMEYMPALFEQYKPCQKEDIIIFPHRVAPEKQPEIFRDLAQSMPQYQFIVCQDNKLSKQEYHKLLSKSKLMWSANLQETLGISPYEGALLGVLPLLPDRLSYSEMYDDKFLYPSEWTESYETYLKFKSCIMERITFMMTNYADETHILADHLSAQYFSATKLTNQLLRK